MFYIVFAILFALSNSQSFGDYEDGMCGEIDGVFYECPLNECCSPYGWCGKGPDYCTTISSVLTTTSIQKQTTAGSTLTTTASSLPSKTEPPKPAPPKSTAVQSAKNGKDIFSSGSIFLTYSTTLLVFVYFVCTILE